jgi:hypothetical protein
MKISALMAKKCLPNKNKHGQIPWPDTLKMNNLYFW